MDLPVRQRSDIDMMTSEESWPYYPFLPMKKPSRQSGVWPTFGVLYAGTTDLYLTNVGEIGGKTIAELQGLEKIHFASYDDILAAGWMVD